jgi:hypothetical protein
MEALLIEEHDPYVNPLGVTGVGEIGITGTAGAIANAGGTCGCGGSQSESTTW